MKNDVEPDLHQYMDFFDQPAIFLLMEKMPVINLMSQEGVDEKSGLNQRQTYSSSLLTQPIVLLDLDFHSTNGPCWSRFRLAHFSALPVFICRQNVTSYSEVEEHYGCRLQVIRSSQLRLPNGSVRWTSPVKQLLLGEMCQLLDGLFKSWPTLQ